MRLPIDTRELRFVVAESPTPVKVFGSDQVKKDRDGQDIYSLAVLVTGLDKADVMTIKVPGPVEAQALEPVVLRGLTAEHWEMGDRSGVSFRATALERPTHGGSKPPARKE